MSKCEQCERLRKALVGLLGADSKEELQAMEVLGRTMPVTSTSTENKAAIINAIHALLDYERGDLR